MMKMPGQTRKNIATCLSKTEFSNFVLFHRLTHLGVFLYSVKRTKQEQIKQEQAYLKQVQI